MGDTNQSRCKNTYENTLFQVVVRRHRRLLTPEDPSKSLLRHTSILELAEHELVVTRQKRAARVTVIGGFGFLAGHRREEVVNHDGNLCRDCRRRLAVRQA